jgi:hypothetical protein
MNRNGYGRRRTWLNLRYYVGFYQELLTKPTSILSQSSLYPGLELHRKFPNVKHTANLSKETFNPLVMR